MNREFTPFVAASIHAFHLFSGLMDILSPTDINEHHVEKIVQGVETDTMQAVTVSGL